MTDTAASTAPILVTGAAGFIGFHVARRLVRSGIPVIAFDNLNDYYDPSLKQARLEALSGEGQVTLVTADIADRPALDAVFAEHGPKRVIHLAAQAGVRYSLVDPESYVRANLVGFGNILEVCRHGAVEHLLYASSSSVYGANTMLPYAEGQVVDHPLSLYAATKKANELMAHTYSHLYRLPTTGLRFFTVYGPWGRPDMALFLFTKAILSGEPITVFNHGDMERDFTYIDDVAEAVIRISGHAPEPDQAWSPTAPNPATSNAPYRIYNIGNNRPERLGHVIEVLERALGRTAQKIMAPIQPGDVPRTCADITDIERDFGFRPSTPIEDGIPRFVDWYRDYFDVH